VGLRHFFSKRQDPSRSQSSLPSRRQREFIAAVSLALKPISPRKTRSRINGRKSRLESISGPFDSFKNARVAAGHLMHRAASIYSFARLWKICCCPGNRREFRDSCRISSFIKVPDNITEISDTKPRFSLYNSNFVIVSYFTQLFITWYASCIGTPANMAKNCSIDGIKSPRK